MGWMQRNMRWLFLGGIIVLVLSTGAGVMALNGPTPDPVMPTPTTSASPEATGTEDPDATPTEEPITRTYSAPPVMEIDEDATYEAVITTAKGTVTVLMDPREAPVYTNNFVFLARNRFFDGLTFHRQVSDFVVQGGDPQGTGFGGPGYLLPEEENNLPFAAGVISMAKSAQGVNGSQFFITLTPQPGLQDDFTVFGQVTEGMDVVLALAPGDVIERVEIVESESEE